jgi:2-iminobutanoate/2-iminopropanoate deaminase
VKVIETGLPVLKVPLEWVVMGEGGILFTSHVAIHENGEFELGDARAQTELIFVNLKMALRAAGADLSNLLQVLIYMTDPANGPVVNQVYAEHIKAPFPNRASFYISALAVTGLRVEFVAYARLAKSTGSGLR